MATFDTNTYDYLDRIRISVEFTTTATPPVFVDPDTVVARFRDPSGVITVRTFGVDPEVVKTGVGRYYTDIDISVFNVEPPRWYYRWEGTGAGAQGSAERAFEIRETQFY
jgi:hypothetical protein